MKQDMTIEQFCDKHDACKDGREWALANCTSMQDVWFKVSPNWLIWVATRPNVLTDKELRLFAVFCARQVQHLMTDSRSHAAIDVAERYAKGEASNEELATARTAARGVARAAARAAAGDAAWAADAAAWEEARDAAREAAWAASTAAWAAWAASALESQANWLRENTEPNFL